MTEGLPTPSDRDFDLLRSTRRRRFWQLALKIVLATLALFLLSLVVRYLLLVRDGEPPVVDASRAALLELNHQWSEDFDRAWGGYRNWFERHGTAFESRAFNGLSAMIVDSMTRSNSAQIAEHELSIFGRIYLGYQSGVIRLLFVLLACMRLALAACVVAFARGASLFKPYRGDDALGQMGNGRVFYSGARAALENITPQGAPDVQIRGLACPQYGSPTEARASQIWRTLSKYGACNSVNEALTRIIVGNRDTAAYVAAAGEDGALSRAFSGDALLGNTACLLEHALRLHASYARGDMPELPNSSQDSSGALSSEAYAQSVACALHASLTPHMRTVLGGLPVCEIATTILAFESGKILAHSYEGGRWTRKSNFPHLSARAVLHSVLEYPREYGLDSRDRIRRGLVYAARKSAFSPVRMPIDLSEQSWALRQWIEVLLSCPHELASVSHEVELVGLVREAHVALRERLLASSSEGGARLGQLGFATQTNLLFLPVGELVRMMRGIVDQPTMARIHTLLEHVRRAQEALALTDDGNENGPAVQFSFERLHQPPSPTELGELASIHGIEPQELRDWLALRVVLSSYGWIASRVGDYSVPHHSVIFAVFKSGGRVEGANDLGLVGRPGMVPLRGSKFAEELGTGWSARFNCAERVTMSETTEQYGKLLRGIVEVKVPEDDDLLVAHSKVQV